MRRSIPVTLAVLSCTCATVLAAGLAAQSRDTANVGLPAVQPPPVDGPLPDTGSAKATDQRGPYFAGNSGYGMDAYGGPFDVLLNRGLVIAQWQNRSRDIFHHDFPWHAVWASVVNPGPAMEAAGGWGQVFKRHVLPFGGDAIREGQWVPNYFGHVLEGGMAYRRLLEWNRIHGVPFPTLVSVLTTQLAVTINEAYETPPENQWVRENGTAGIFMDWVLFDPLGMLVFHHDGVARYFAEELGADIWMPQAAIVVPGGLVMNNGKSAVFRPNLWFTDRARLFVRTGLGLEVGLSFPRADGYEVAVAAGLQSTTRSLDPDTHLESARFAASAGTFIERDGVLIFSVTADQRTDRLLAINLYPGLLRIAGWSPGAWFILDSEKRVFFGFSTPSTLGLGFGVGL